MCGRFRADWTAVNFLPNGREDDVVDEAGDRLLDFEDEIAATPAASLAGIAAPRCFKQWRPAS